MMLQLHTNKWGGTEMYIEQMAQTLARAGGVLHVWVLSASEQVRRRWESSGVQVRESECSWRAVRAVLGVVEPDVVMLHFFPMCSALPWWIRTCSEARVVMVDDHSGWPRFRGFLRRWGGRQRHRLALAPVDRVVAVSEFVAHRLTACAGVAPEDVHVQYNGVRAPHHVAELPVFSGSKVIMAAGHMIPEKGFGVLLRAAQMLEERHDFEVVFVGEGPASQELRRQASELQVRVHFLGMRQDVPELFAAADIVVVPSLWHEAFGFVAAEAMRAGAAVVASNIGGLPEFVHHEETGLLVRPGDAESLARALERLLLDMGKARELASAGRWLACQHLSVERMSEGMTKLLEEVVA